MEPHAPSLHDSSHPKETCTRKDDQGAGALAVTGSLRRISGNEVALESRKPYATADHINAGNVRYYPEAGVSSSPSLHVHPTHSRRGALFLRCSSNTKLEPA